jgi:hypothetical protein
MNLADQLEPREVQHPAPFWYRWLSKLWPSRCRECPEPQNPTWCEHKVPSAAPPHACTLCGAPARILLRQFSIWRRRWYLQSFACSEGAKLHSHPCRIALAIGIWGRYTEHRIAGAPWRRAAPYFYVLDAGHVHRVDRPSRGHTALFLMFGIRHDIAGEDKAYYGAPVVGASDGLGPETRIVGWTDYIIRKVPRT